MTLRKMAPADTLTSAGAFLCYGWSGRGTGCLSGVLCGSCDFGQLRRPMLKRLFANAFCAEAVFADDGGRGCRNGCLRGLLPCGGNGMH